MPDIARVLTIAGSDSGGGAGIQADLKTFAAFGVYGMSAVTAVTAQNTLGVQAATVLPLDLIEAQVRCVASDIGVNAVKTGMLANPQVAALIAQLVVYLRLPNVVVDPVLSAKGGYRLLADGGLDVLRTKLLPQATVLTPNLEEASALLGRPVNTLDDMAQAARDLAEMGPAWVVVKGGHLPASEEAVDVVFQRGGSVEELRSPRIPTSNTHGTGCTFSSAIAAGLARGQSVGMAIRNAKSFVAAAIQGSLGLGQGHGPLQQMAGVTSPWAVG